MVPEGGEIPRGFGLAYYLPDRPLWAAYPIPFNLVIGWSRIAWWWLMCPPWRFAVWRAGWIRRHAYEEGFNEGYITARTENAARGTEGT